jgi:YMGG-like Gly-zipper
MNNRIKITAVMASIVIALSGCMQSGPEQQHTATGAILGAGAGAIAGNNIGGISTTEGAIAGAIIGGLLGHSSGRQQTQMDSQQAQIDAMRAEQNRMIVNIANSNGSTTPVVLHKIGYNQWEGPRGEIYNGVPSSEQLKPVYGF